MKSLEVAHTIRVGAIGLSISHGSDLSQVIGKMQGRPNKHDDLPELSHGFVCQGRGKIVEQTFPKGREGSIGKYMGRNFTTYYFDPPWSEPFKAAFVAQMRSVSMGTKYQIGDLFLHLADNLVERLSWDRESQRGKRPLASIFRTRLVKDPVVCTGAMGLSVYRLSGMQINPDIPPGAERPLDWWFWCRLNATFVGMNHLGEWYTHLLADPSMGSLEVD